MNFDDLAISAIICDLESAWNALIDEAIDLGRMNDVFALYATSGKIPGPRMRSYLPGDWSEYSEKSVPWAARIAERATYLVRASMVRYDGENGKEYVAAHVEFGGVEITVCDEDGNESSCIITEEQARMLARSLRFLAREYERTTKKG